MRPFLTLAAWLVSLWLCWLLVRLSHATSLARRGQGRTHLLLTLAAVVGLFAACYPSAQCVTSCGVTFTGTDCAGFDRLESATVAAFATCDAGSPDDACSALSGWTVRVLPESETFSVGDAGSRGWRPSPDEAKQLCVENPKTCDPSDAGQVAWVQAHGHVSGETAIDHHITLADEAWRDGNAATELVHAATGQYHGGDAYADEQWSDVGRACVVSTAQRAPLVLTGSEGGP